MKTHAVVCDWAAVWWASAALTICPYRFGPRVLAERADLTAGSTLAMLAGLLPVFN